MLQLFFRWYVCARARACVRGYKKKRICACSYWSPCRDAAISALDSSSFCEFFLVYKDGYRLYGKMQTSVPRERDKAEEFYCWISLKRVLSDADCPLRVCTRNFRRILDDSGEKRSSQQHSFSPADRDSAIVKCHPFCTLQGKAANTRTLSVSMSVNVNTCFIIPRMRARRCARRLENERSSAERTIANQPGE